MTIYMIFTLYWYKRYVECLLNVWEDVCRLYDYIRDLRLWILVSSPHGIAVDDYIQRTACHRDGSSGQCGPEVHQST